MHLLETEEDFKNKKSKDTVKLLCEYCNLEFLKRKIDVIMARKYESSRPNYGKMDFCSRKCSSKTPKDEVKKLVESNGLKIIEQEDYVGKNPLIYYHCPTCQKKTSKRQTAFRYKVFQCSECQDDKIKADRKDKFYKVKEFLKINNYILVTTEADFINSGARTEKTIKTVCPNRHESNKPIIELVRGILRPCRVCMLKEKSGPKCNLYVDGRNQFNKDERARIGSLLKSWRKQVLNKFKKKCNICGNGEKLHAHHLNGFLLDPANRLNVENGVCLCKKCHIKFHTDFGKKNNTKEEYEKFLKNETTPLVLDWSNWEPA
jgi:ribosomal protein L37AE/L43A